MSFERRTKNQRANAKQTSKPNVNSQSLAKLKTKTNSAQLDFDLHQQVVNIIVGERMRYQQYSKLIKEHNGTPVVTEAFVHQSNNRSYFENQLKNSDIVILVQNYNKHNTSKTITSICNQNHQKFAISNSLGLQSIEQAIYRADQTLPAYEPVNSTIDYPMFVK